MIAFIAGRVSAAGAEGAVVEVGGVGVSLLCTPATLATLRVGERAHLPTSLVVREESLTLYGFADDDERAVFELLQTASGVGPRLALAMLAVHDPNALRRTVATGDVAALTKVPGIGKKGAQRIVLELKDRLGGYTAGDTDDVVMPTRTSIWQDQVHSGLVNLGWSGRDADAAVEAVASEAEETTDVAVLLRSALRRLSTR